VRERRAAFARTKYVTLWAGTVVVVSHGVFLEHLLDGALRACVASHAAGAAISQLRAAPCCSQVVAIQMQVQEIRIQIDHPADAPLPPPSPRAACLRAYVALARVASTWREGSAAAQRFVASMRSFHWPAVMQHTA
jgi:hypothetical protein